jgi:hypothetical protein
MEESFQIPVTHHGKELLINARLIQIGYARKIQVDVNGIIVDLEKDDEGNFRAVLAEVKDENKVDKQLIKQVVESLEKYK